MTEFKTLEQLIEATVEDRNEGAEEHDLYTRQNVIEVVLEKKPRATMNRLYNVDSHAIVTPYVGYTII